MASLTVKQVTKSNFAASLHQFKSDIQSAEFVSISLRKTGDFSSSSSSSRYLPWLRILPFDTSATAYLKSKLSAESFALLHFSVCPFSIRSSKLLAFPYNFHLFPRDELALGIPSYSFSCHTSFLSSMARDGFDFNSCVYDGLSYLSRVQEANATKRKLGSWMPPSSVADSIFKERVKSRVGHWKKACQDGSFMRVLLGGEAYGSRPGLTVDVCSEKQVQLVFETVEHVSHDLVPVIIADDVGQVNAVRVVLTSSEEDKRILLEELRNIEDEQDLKLRGFRQVIDLISGSHKTVVSHNCLRDFTFIHEKFVGPLPASLPEFMCSLRLLFSNVIDLNHLLKEFGPSLRRAKNVSTALSYLKRRYFVPMELEVPEQAEDGKNKSHGSNAVRLAFLFAKLNMLLKNAPSSRTAHEHTRSIEDYANIFNPALLTLRESGDDDEASWCIDTTRRVSTDSILFFWGFGGTTSAVELKHRLLQIHPVFSEEFDVHLVDKTCAVVVFGKSGYAETLLKDMSSVDTVSGVLREMVVEGLRAAGYDAYQKVCRLGLWEGDLADSLEIALADTVEDLCSSSRTNTNEIHWNNEMMVDLNDL